MAVAGHDGSSDHTLRMAAMAVDMLAAAEDVQHQIMAQGKDGRRVQIRIGMHTGGGCMWRLGTFLISSWAL
jgi:class 3 adenylate cyclase